MSKESFGKKDILKYFEMKPQAVSKTLSSHFVCKHNKDQKYMFLDKNYIQKTKVNTEYSWSLRDSSCLTAAGKYSAVPLNKC